MKNIKIYLDNCCYNRPFDDQTQLRISLETQAKLFIQSLVIKGNVDLIWSYISDLENSENPYETRKVAISDFSKYAKRKVLQTSKIIYRANKITAAGLSPADALHLSCAINAGVKYFISVDDKILKYKTDGINIINPIDFIQIWENRNEKNK